MIYVGFISFRAPRKVQHWNRNRSVAIFQENQGAAGLPSLTGGSTRRRAAVWNLTTEGAVGT